MLGVATHIGMIRSSSSSSPFWTLGDAQFGAFFNMNDDWWLAILDSLCMERKKGNFEGRERFDVKKIEKKLLARWSSLRSTLLHQDKQTGRGRRDSRG